MADDPTKRGPPDRRRVSKQPHEVTYLARQTQSNAGTVLQAVRTHGTSRKEVVQALAKRRKQ